MRGGRERIDPEVVKAVEEAVMPRILALSDKEVTAKFGISRASVFRIIRAAKQRLRAGSMKQLSQSPK